ncbi:hypothetical protein FGG08_007680 [Glutinoglossum americanum]|uniref:Terminase small subunit n=1 Tax=Glutinoglossum americanum TaxID=1670608 RepID=A0A9P8HYA4_9PEZI|nr:hypothetical protein FGG08_007680 [Glutinoglossum americanum]
MPSKKVNTAEAAEQTHAPISHQHQQFVDAIVRGATPTDAYMEVFPGTTRVSAYNSSSRLLKKPEIWQRVSDGQMAAQLRRQQQAREHIIEQLTRIEARLLTLADIIDGRWQHKDTTINKDTGHVIERYRSDPKAALQAIKLEMKLEEQRTLLREQLNTIDSQMQNTSEKE